MTHKSAKYFLFALSFLVVTLSQPDWSPLCGVLTAIIGFALFWRGMLLFQRRSARFLVALVWFGAVQGVQLSWLTADHYVGAVIYLVVAFFLVALGLQFALVSLFVKERMSVIRCLGVAGAWALLEWARLFFLSGYTWNPVGLALSGTFAGMQLASAVGVFGMSFWIFFANLLALKVMTETFAWRAVTVWALVAATPFVFGYAQVAFHEAAMKNDVRPPFSAVLVQTGLHPEEKVAYGGSGHRTYSPVEQWERILTFLKPHLGKEIDLIALSESTVPYGTDLPIYDASHVALAFEDILGMTEIQNFPPATKEGVGNGYWAHVLANTFNADVVVGLEDYDDEHAYNAAFFVRPFSSQRNRYEKRVLVPMGEYIPFEWTKQILSKYGIRDSFSPGTEAKVFEGKRVPVGLSICYEETFGHLMRETREKGALLLVNMSNDAWYPGSRLPYVHFMHGRLRAVEAGLPLVRSCNTGVTCGVNSFGQMLGCLAYDNGDTKCEAGALHLTLSGYTYPTLYSRVGDRLPIGFAFACLLLSILFELPREFRIKYLGFWPLRKS